MRASVRVCDARGELKRTSEGMWCLKTITVVHWERWWASVSSETVGNLLIPSTECPLVCVFLSISVTAMKFSQYE